MKKFLMRGGMGGVCVWAALACGSVRGPERQADAGPGGGSDAGRGDAAVLVDAPPPGKRVFATSSTFAASFGSVAAADKICNDTAAGKLGGAWRAWISLPAPNDVRTRFAHSTARYVLVDGTTVIANSWDDLISGSIRHAIDHDENGAALQAASGCVEASCFSAWTATDSAGAYTPSFDCMGWTSTGNDPGITGNTAMTTTEWTRMNTISSSACARRARLYCFEQ